MKNNIKATKSIRDFLDLMQRVREGGDAGFQLSVHFDVLASLEEHLREEIRPPKPRHLRRTREALPDPSQSADAEINRRGQQISLRISENLLQDIDTAVEADKAYDRTTWFKDAAASMLTSTPMASNTQSRSEPQSATIMLRFDPKLIEQIDQAAQGAGLKRAVWLRQAARSQLQQPCVAQPSPSEQ